MCAWIIVVAACSSSTAPATLENQAPLPAVDPGGDSIAFSRDECLDLTYRAVIHRDGRVEWRGLTNVRVVGNAVGTVEARELDKLRVAFDLARFDERNPDGRLGTSDDIHICADGWIFTIARVQHGMRHQIEHSYHCPHDDGLEALERLLEATVAAWK